MSADRDTTRIVRSWLRTDEHESADRVLDAVLDRLDTTPQRRITWWPARRFLQMSTATKVGLAATIVVVAALIGLNYLVSPRIGGPNPDDPSPSPTATAMPTQELPARGLPGARGGPAGEYGWQGRSDTRTGLGGRTGMHRVVGASEATAMFFAAGEDCAGSDDTSERVPVTVAGFEGTYIEPYDPAVTFNNVGDEITRAYELRVGRSILCVFVTWHPTTTREDIDAALDILDTLRAQELGEEVLRINFTLPDGWDTG